MAEATAGQVETYRWEVGGKEEGKAAGIRRRDGKEGKWKETGEGDG